MSVSELKEKINRKRNMKRNMGLWLFYVKSFDKPLTLHSSLWARITVEGKTISLRGIRGRTQNLVYYV